MAIVRISWRDTEHLPDVCMKCGQRARLDKDKSFSWHPPWVIALLFLGGLGLIIYIIVAIVLTKRMFVRVPLCRDHKNPWLGTYLFTVLGLVAVIGYLISSLGVELTPGPQLRFGGALLGSSALVFVVWLVIAIILNLNIIRPVEITERSIRLTNVAGEFREAYEDLLEEEYRRDRDDDERWPRNRVDYDDFDIRPFPRRRERPAPRRRRSQYDDPD